GSVSSGESPNAPPTAAANLMKVRRFDICHSRGNVCPRNMARCRRVVTYGETGRRSFASCSERRNRCRPANRFVLCRTYRSATDQILMFRPLVRLLAGAAVLAGISCGPPGTDTTLSPTSRVLTTLVVTVTPTSIQVGESAVAAATGADQNGAAMPVSTIDWTSSNQSVATVTSTGNITAVGPGTTQIAATSGGKTGQALLTVTSNSTSDAVTSIRLTPATLSVQVGSTTQLSAATT